MSQQLKRMEGECAFLSWAVGGQTIKTDAKSLVEYAVSDAAEDSYCDAACVTTQQTGDTRNTINLKYIENNKKNKKICKNFLKNFTINIGNFF